MKIATGSPKVSEGIALEQGHRVLGPAMRIGFVAAGIALLVPGHGFAGALAIELAGAALAAVLVGSEILRSRARASRV